jgi:hypothetical protein
MWLDDEKDVVVLRREVAAEPGRFKRTFKSGAIRFSWALINIAHPSLPPYRCRELAALLAALESRGDFAKK